MRLPTRKHLLAGMVLAGLTGGVIFAQPLPQPRPQQQPVPQKQDDNVEVLARGQLHEAFATSNEQPSATPVIEQQPPAPVEELPPDQKPEGDNVLWIPGYWDWDEDDKEFTWISGFWRNAPVGRVWVPGDWREVKGGWQWVPGFWNVVTPQQAQPPELEYLPPPPEPIEQGPSVAAPSDDCFYTPGCWVYKVNRYVWRPGFWVVHRPDWVWVPDHYRWTPCGYVFVPGYWDAPLATRGVLFAPVRFRAAVLRRPRFVYTPAYVVPDTSLHTCLFVRTGRVSYFFGDYFEQRYVALGFSSWSGVTVRRTEVITRRSYDPLWSYYSLSYRDTPQWQTNVTTVYTGRFRGEVPRPPRTLVQQNTVINNVTNNNTVIVNNPPAQPVIAPLAELPKVASQPVTFKKVADAERVQEQKQAKEIRQIAAERKKLETALVDKGLVVKKDDKPRQAKLEVPQAVTARVQERAKAAKPEIAPPPPAAADPKADPKADPTPAAKPAVKLPPPPVIDPKTGAVQQKRGDDPKPTDPAKPGVKPTDPVQKPTDPPAKPTTPTVPGKPTDPVKPTDPPKPPVKPVDPPKPGDPKPMPKPADPTAPKPKDPPKTDPKPVDPPKPPVTPPTTPAPKPTDPKPKDPPKADPPKPPVTPPATPPVSPKPVDPPKPKDPPKVDPPAPKPKDPPKTDPKPVDPPKPKNPPKADPPKPPVTLPTTPAPKPKDPPKADPPKPVVPVAPVTPPKADPPKAPVTPVPKVNPPKPPVTPPASPKPADPPKPKDPPKADPPKPKDPPKSPANPPTKPKDPKDKK